MTSPSRWTTSSLGRSADALPGELSALGAHLDQCKTLGGVFALRCGVDAAYSFITARIMTTLVVSALLVGAAVLAS